MYSFTIIIRFAFIIKTFICKRSKMQHLTCINAYNYLTDQLNRSTACIVIIVATLQHFQCIDTDGVTSALCVDH